MSTRPSFHHLLEKIRVDGSRRRRFRRRQLLPHPLDLLVTDDFISSNLSMASTTETDLQRGIIRWPIPSNTRSLQSRLDISEMCSKMLPVLGEIALEGRVLCELVEMLTSVGIVAGELYQSKLLDLGVHAVQQLHQSI
jgi:hypothetical protein